MQFSLSISWEDAASTLARTSPRRPLRIGYIFLKASPPPADLPSPEGALRELLCALDLYKGAGAHVAPYVCQGQSFLA